MWKSRKKLSKKTCSFQGKVLEKKKLPPLWVGGVPPVPLPPFPMEEKPRVEDAEKVDAQPNSIGSLKLRLFQRRERNLHLFKAVLWPLL